MNNRLKMMKQVYSWQQKGWPNFTYSLDGVAEKLYSFGEQTGLMSGVLMGLPDNPKMDAVIEMMVAEAIKTSEIEGEFLSRRDVMSSIKNDLGLNPVDEPVVDKRSKGVGRLMINVRETYAEPLTKTQLFLWHKLLFDGDKHMQVGAWRSHAEPMQVVSGALGKQRVHFEAPPSADMPRLMDEFITWFNDTAPGGRHQIKKAPVRCAIAHLYFETVHPFEDGNGRIGRAVAEKALSQGMGRPALLSLSRTIEAAKSDYYSALETAQRTLNATPWISYFMDVILASQQYAGQQIDFTLKKAKFFDTYRDKLNPRQLKVIRRVLEEGPEGFDGGLNASKYGSLTKTSKATATRDLQDLLEKGAITQLAGGGRSTKYEVKL